MTKIYRLLKEMPRHYAGDLLYKYEQDAAHYEWQKAPHYPMAADLVESTPEYFEEVITGWEKGQALYFINIYGEIMQDDFHPAKHSKLVLFGNAFKTQEAAQHHRDTIKLLNTSDSACVITREDMYPIFAALCDGRYEEAKDQLSYYI